jgi:hypothetical protein
VMGYRDKIISSLNGTFNIFTKRYFLKLARGCL